MAFTIHYARGDKAGYDSYDDAHAIVVRDGGLLEVTKNGEEVALYSPHYWTHVNPGEKHRTVPAR
ncbi:hypothetical protein ABW16_15330 [Mycolicibacter heraklionensis]|uniref:Uncharacterized protein n=1 Tax=Mycolicibacter heraklionensis TaxID=512402 RepID=A0ABR5FD41_9MYCO|nr:hypothetical protein [Mycolicibacter heraklionensis]KLO27630.1 hypothetical protein ABW16_15330 [Mycolicibacter heraklionensis]